MSLVGWWKLNGDTKDSSIYKKHATNSGATLTTGGPLGSCYEFNDDYMVVDTDEKYIFKDINHTISCWVYPISLATSNTYNYIVAFGNNSVGNQISVGITSSGNIYQSAYTSPIITFDYTVSLNTWYHILITHIDGISYLYINGELKEQKTVDFSPTTGKFYIGSHTGNASYFKNAYFTDIRVYNHVLSLKEIKELSKCKVLHYTCNQFQEPTTNYINNIYNYSTQIQTGDMTITQETYNGQDALKVVVTGTDPYVKIGFNDYYYGLATYESITGGLCVESPDVTITGLNGDANLYFATQTFSGYGSVWHNWWKEDNRIFATCTIPEGYDYSTTNTMMTVFFKQAGTYYVWRPQIEFKDHSTPFVDGTRTGTVYDCSGYEHHASLTETTTPKWVEGGPVGTGYYEFDGIDYFSRTNIFTDNINQKWTVCAWVKIPDTTIENVYLVEGFNLGCRLIHSSTRKALLYINSGDNDSYTYSDIYLPENVWFHIAYVLNTNTQRCQIYINGVEHGTSTNYSETDIPAGFGSNMIIGTNLKGFLSDVRIYATDLSEDAIKEIYQSRASIDNNKNVYVNKIKEDKYVDAILDYSTWTIGTTGSQTGFSRNGLESENYIIEGQDPFGNTIPIWEARPDDVSGADGGWVTTPYFDIDNTKYYRFSTWVKRTVKGNGHFYLGLNGYDDSNTNIGVLYRISGSVNTNPYFQVNSNWTEWESGLTNKWYLVVGHVFPVGSGTGSNHPESGVYDLNGNKVKIAEADFVWQSDVVKSRHRSYLYYSTDTSTRQQWCYPRVDVCDGSEPTISDLINGVDYEHYKILKGEEKSGSIKKTGLIKVNEVNTVGPTNGLVLYMPLNGDTRDYSGNNNDGTNNGATIVQGLGNKLAYNFDGTDYINLIPSNQIIINNNSWSIGAWFNAASIGDGIYANRIITFMRSTGDSTGVSLLVGSTNILKVMYSNASSTQVYLTKSDITTNTWYHIFASFDGTTLKMYVDGSFHDSATDGFSGLSSGTARIGTYNSSSYRFNGLIQDVRVYSRVLSSEEISWLYDMYNPNKNIGAKIFNNNIIYSNSFKEGY